MIVIVILSFIMSFIFALGGIGAAVVLVPILFWLGVPLNYAKPTGLFLNTLSLTVASISNIKKKSLTKKNEDLFNIKGPFDFSVPEGKACFTFITFEKCGDAVAENYIKVEGVKRFALIAGILNNLMI